MSYNVVMNLPSTEAKIEAARNVAMALEEELNQAQDRIVALESEVKALRAILDIKKMMSTWPDDLVPTEDELIAAAGFQADQDRE